MNKSWLILRYEWVTTVTRASFLFTAIGIPIIAALSLMILSALSRSSPQMIDTVMGGGSSSANSEASKPQGYVDSSGLVQVIPESVAPGSLVAYPNEAAAKQALQDGQTRGYFLISSDYLQNGEVIYVSSDFNPLTSLGQSNVMQWVLQVNLAGGDPQLANQLNNPLDLQVTILEPGAERDEDNPLTFFVPYFVTLLDSMIILMTSSLLLNSISKEKENRVIEMLMSAATPLELLTGKIAGLGLAGLLQMILWVGTSFMMLRLRGTAIEIPANFQLPGSFLVWFVIFFIFGYAVYASLMAALGALAPNLREASQVTFVIILPLIIPLLLISVMIREPNGLLATTLSIFPFTAPVAMMTRLAIVAVPWQQLGLSLALLALTAVLIVRSVGRMFQAQALLSGQSFSLPRFFNALAGRTDRR